MSKRKLKKPNQKKGLKKRFYQVVVLIVAAAFILFFIYPNNFMNNENNGKEKLSGYNSFEFAKEGELTFSNADGKFITQIDIEIADDNNRRTTGLMYRNEMGKNQGMFFIFPNESYQSFWMRNTVLPLDILFVNSKNEIVTIHKNTIPFDESSYPSTKPAMYVVEVNAGFTDQYNIKSGDKISWRRI